MPTMPIWEREKAERKIWEALGTAIKTAFKDLSRLHHDAEYGRETIREYLGDDDNIQRECDTAYEEEVNNATGT